MHRASGRGKTAANATARPGLPVFADAALDELVAVLEHMLNGVAYCRMLYENGRPHDVVYLYTNPAFSESTGLHDVVGRKISEVIPGIFEADPGLIDIYGRVASTGRPETFETFVEPLQQWFSVSAYSPARDHFVAVFDVVTEYKRLQENSRMADDLYRAIVATSHDAISISRLSDGHYLDINESFLQQSGWSRDEVIGRTALDIHIWRDLADRQRLIDAVAREGYCRGLEAEYVRRDGQVLTGLMSAHVLDYRGEKCLICSVRDISERKAIDQQIQQLAFQDPLTHLPNRHLFKERLERTLVQSKRSGHWSALLFLDLDNFKPLNDQHGHEVGDVLLVEAAQRMRHCVREMDTIARFGGDEFVVILGELGHDRPAAEVQARGVAEKLSAELGQPYQLAHAERSGDPAITHCCTVSIGVALFDCCTGNPAAIVRAADAAMYKAKSAGRNSIFLEPGDLNA